MERQNNNNRPINLPKVITFFHRLQVRHLTLRLSYTMNVYQHYIYMHTYTL